MKRIFTLLLSILITATTWAQDSWSDNVVDFTQHEDNNGINDGSPEKPFILSEPGHLAFLAQEINRSNEDTYRSLSYVLKNDIDLGGRLWIPIGVRYHDRGIYAFKGIFDGQGNTISGLTVVAGQYDQVAGLFGQIKADEGKTVELKNLTITEGNVNGSNGWCYYVGTLAGQMISAGGTITIENCHNKSVTISKPDEVTNSHFAGGLIASIRANQGTSMDGTIIITGCTNEATIQGSHTNSFSMRNYTGGIVGSLEAPASYDGLTCSVHIINCHNKGEIFGGTAENTVEHCGGIFGCAMAAGGKSTGAAEISIVNCTNSGIVLGGEATLLYTGGIGGYISCGSQGVSKVFTTELFNEAEIYGGDALSAEDKNYTGGIFGYASSSTSTESFTMEYLYNTGNITGGSGVAYTGGLMGLGASAGKGFTISSSVNTGDIEGGQGSLTKTGGLSGELRVSNLRDDLYLLESYSIGNVTSHSGYAGGLIGETGASAYYGNYQITNCYAAGSVIGNAACAGGITGRILRRKEYPLPVISGCIAVMNELKGNSVNLIAGGYFNIESVEEIEKNFPDGIFNNNYSWHPTILSGSSDNEKGAEWETGTFQEEPFLTFISDGNWELDADNERMPWLRGLKHNQPIFPNPWQKKTPPPPPPVPTVYYTITLELGAGIQANYRAGDLTVGEGEYLYLQFGADDPAVTAADVLFVIDGEETTFKNPGAGYNFTYTLRDIQDDCKVVIALRHYNVTLPSVSGGTTDPEAGTHPVAYGGTFCFTLTTRNEQEPGDIRVYANGNTLTPDNEGNDNVYRYSVHNVTDHQTITIEGVDPTGNIPIGNAEMNITMDNGQLTIDNYGNPVTCTIYTLTGQLYATRPLPEGTTTVDLPQGAYIVRAGRTTVKVLSH